MQYSTKIARGTLTGSLTELLIHAVHRDKVLYIAHPEASVAVHSNMSATPKHVGRELRSDIVREEHANGEESDGDVMEYKAASGPTVRAVPAW